MMNDYMLANCCSVQGLITVVPEVLATHSSEGGVSVSVSGSGHIKTVVTDGKLWMNACPVGFVLD